MDADVSERSVGYRHDHFHAVEFSDDLAAPMQRFAAYLQVDGRPEDVAVIIATAERMRAAEGLLPPCERIVLDADETLDSLSVGGAPDRAAFDRVIGDLMRDAASDGRRVVGFGEMVGLLWARGDVLEAIALEQFWNDLQQEVPFSLFCAYPHQIDLHRSEVRVEAVCALHTDEHRMDDDGVVRSRAKRRFAHAAPSATLARRFTTGTLRRWGLDHHVEEAALIATELTANVITHTRSHPEIMVSTDGSTTRIAVTDQSGQQVEKHQFQSDTVSGRGLTLVDALASEWGSTPTPDGKMVWADLDP
jgi:anti-sigma regulatory factor (Ser/Thr protein kinase)